MLLTNPVGPSTLPDDYSFKYEGCYTEKASTSDADTGEKTRTDCEAKAQTANSAFFALAYVPSYFN